MKTNNVEKNYLTPEVEVVETLVEAGFQNSNSSNVEDPIEDGVQGWY